MLALVLSGVFIAIVAVALFRKKKTTPKSNIGGGGNYKGQPNRDGKFKNDLES